MIHQKNTSAITQHQLKTMTMHRSISLYLLTARWTFDAAHSERQQQKHTQRCDSTLSRNIESVILRVDGTERRCLRPSTWEWLVNSPPCFHWSPFLCRGGWRHCSLTAFFCLHSIFSHLVNYSNNTDQSFWLLLLLLCVCSFFNIYFVSNSVTLMHLLKLWSI